MLKNRISICIIFQISLLVFIFSSCKEDKIELINRKFTVNLQTDTTETYINQPIKILVISEDFDKKNTDEISTTFQIKSGQGSIKVSNTSLNPGENLLHDFNKNKSFYIEYYPQPIF